MERHPTLRAVDRVLEKHPTTPTATVLLKLRELDEPAVDWACGFEFGRPIVESGSQKRLPPR